MYWCLILKYNNSVSALTMSISQACIHEGDLIGVVGVDLHMEDIAQDITYFNQEEDSYAFIINTDGE